MIKLAASLPRIRIVEDNIGRSLKQKFLYLNYNYLLKIELLYEFWYYKHYSIA